MPVLAPSSVHSDKRRLDCLTVLSILFESASSSKQSMVPSMIGVSPRVLVTTLDNGSERKECHVPPPQGQRRNESSVVSLDRPDTIRISCADNH